MQANQFTILAPISVGELVDKITILHLKRKNIKAEDPLANINLELNLLEDAFKSANLSQYESVLNPLIEALQDINRQLWDVEDDLRTHESKQEFNDKFIQLARSVYKLNDKRAFIKKNINQACGSTLVEEKSYREY